ncbi:hypothetical protein BDV06DRAFT_235248 [Aspergillus oleicola]
MNSYRHEVSVWEYDEPSTRASSPAPTHDTFDETWQGSIGRISSPTPVTFYSDPSHLLIAEVSNILAGKGIGALLWGEHLLRTYGSSINAHDYKFLLEDAAILPAYITLLDAGFDECPETYPCPVVHKLEFLLETRRSGRPVHASKHHGFPAKHVHFNTGSGSNNLYPIVVGLYRKSIYLPSQFALLDPPDIMPGEMGRLGSHGRFLFAHELRPRVTENHSGRFPDELEKDVLIPSPMYLVETLILLGNRDSRTPGARSIWTNWLMHLREAYICHNKGLAAWDDRSLLPELLRPVWKEAIDSEISRIDEPIMHVWRDLAWTLAGVDVGFAKMTGHLGYEESLNRISVDWVWALYN